MKNFFTFVPLIALCLSLVSDENSTSHLETIV